MTENTLDLTPEKLLPHDHPMILIDAVDSYGDDFAVALITPGIGKPFADWQGNVPVWVGMEYMAQCIAIYAGIQAQQKGLPIKVGFLLGTRSYDIETDQFDSGQTYAIRVQKTFEDSSLSAFACSIHRVLHHDDNNEQSEPCLVKAVINTFQPDNIDEFMEGKTS